MRPSLQFCWMEIFPWIKLSWHSCSMWDKLGWLNWFWQFLCDGLSLIRKDSITHMHGLAVYVKEGLPFAWDLSLENSADSYWCFWLALLCSVSYFFFLYWSPLLFSLLFWSLLLLSSWWKEDKTTTEGTHLETLTFLDNFHQFISEATHLQPHSNSCIDLIFTDQPNLVVSWGTHSSLNSFCKLNLNIE